MRLRCLHQAVAIALALLTLGLAACSPSARPTPAPIGLSGRLLPPYNEGALADAARPSQRVAAPVATAAPKVVVEPTAVPKQDRVNVLLLGVDERETWSEGPPRTDALMLASADPATGQVSVLSLPRDLWVSIPGFGPERINVAYRVAEMTAPGTGPDTAAATVSEFLGVPVDRYVVVNFRAVREIVDSLGGLEVDVPYEIWDHQYPTESNGYMTVHFPAGPQKLSGEQVLQYVRTRHGSSDFERMRRQQQIIAALQARVTRADFIPKAPGFLLVARDCVQTNLSVNEMIGLWSDFHDISRDAVRLTVIDETYSYPWITSAGADVLLPNEAAIQQLVADLGLGDREGDAALAQGLQVRLFSNNSEDVNYASAAHALSQAGYTISQGGVATNTSGHTLVLDYGDGSVGANLAEALGLESVQVLRQPKAPGLPEELAADVLLWSSGTAG